MDEATCTRCGETKPREFFYRDKRRKSGLYSWCKTCFTAHCRSNYDGDRDRARRRRWLEERGGRATTAARVAAWRKAQPQRWSELNREYQARRRSGDEPVDFAAILAEHGMVCHLCDGEIPSLNDLHFDHVIPLSKDGPHRAENIRPSHARCNLRKGARLAA